MPSLVDIVFVTKSAPTSSTCSRLCQVGVGVVVKEVVVWVVEYPVWAPWLGDMSVVAVVGCTHAACIMERKGDGEDFGGGSSSEAPAPRGTDSWCSCRDREHDDFGAVPCMYRRTRDDFPTCPSPARTTCWSLLITSRVGESLLPITHAGGHINTQANTLIRTLLSRSCGYVGEGWLSGG